MSGAQPVDAVARERLRRQGISHPVRGEPTDIVRRLLAVQAQDYIGAKWSIGLRLRGVTDADVDRACDAGEILRTHVLRPTWHFVLPADIRWLLTLTGPRVLATNASMSRKLGIDARVLDRGFRVFAAELARGRVRTRAELGAALEAAGVRPATGQRLAYLVMHAEQEALLCSGPRRGRQFTYALLDARAPRARPMARTDALAELGRRYFTSRGPATVRDLARWSSLTVADATRAADAVRDELGAEMVGKREHFRSAGKPPAGRVNRRAHLLCIYDEYIAGYRDRSAIITPVNAATIAGRGAAVTNVVVIDGEVLGTWSRTFGKREVDLTIAPFGRLTRARQALVREAAAPFGDFVGLTPRVTFA